MHLGAGSRPRGAADVRVGGHHGAQVPGWPEVCRRLMVRRSLMLRWVFALVAVALCASGCSSSPSASIVDSPGSGGSSGSVSSAPAGGGPSAQQSITGGGAEPQLASDVCDMLDVATINSITGLDVGRGKSLGPSDAGASGGCLWGGVTQGVQLTAFPAAAFAAEKRHAQASGTSVPGVGHAAWTRASRRWGACTTSCSSWITEPSERSSL